MSTSSASAGNSSSSELVGWTTEGGGRGTWALLWSCLSTIFLSLWVAWHPNVPFSLPAGLVANLFIVGLRIVYFLYGVIFPELYPAIAASHLHSARAFKHSMERLGFQCTLTQAFYVAMGGYVLVDESEGDMHVFEPSHFLWLLERNMLRLSRSDCESGAEYTNEIHSLRLVKQAQTPLIEPQTKNGATKPTTESSIEDAFSLSIKDPPARAESPDQTRIPENITKAAADSAGTTKVSTMYFLDGEDIEGKSQADWLAKFIVMFQVTWFIVDSIARAAHQLTVSPLEILTVSYICCSLIAYVFWFKKPYQVSRSVRVRLSLSTTQWKELETAGSQGTWQHFSVELNDFNRWVDSENATASWGMSLFLCTFLVNGGIHLLAWNAVFPSSVEQTIWRVAALVVMIAPLSLGDARMIHGGRHLTSARTRWLISTIAGAIYVPAKLFLIVEAFASLRASPPATYET